MGQRASTRGHSDSGEREGGGDGGGRIEDSWSSRLETSRSPPPLPHLSLSSIVKPDTTAWARKEVKDVAQVLHFQFWEKDTSMTFTEHIASTLKLHHFSDTSYEDDTLIVQQF